MNNSNAPMSSSIRQKTNQNIQVYVRVRPLNVREKTMRSNEIVEVSLPKEILVRYTQDFKMTKKFTFDRAFGQDSKQCDVYHTVVAPLIEEVLSGYNCTVFAYGQTGTGKTHTMIGTECPELKSSWEDESMIGIIPRALSHLLDELRLMQLEYTMRISYLELYNEELCDLLSTDDTVKIRIYDDSTKKGSVIIQGLEEVIVHNKDEVYKLLEKGHERRRTATTLMNAQSSRSHTVFSILVHIKESGIDGEEMLKIGKLNLVDLAGSENISKAGNEKGIRTRETVNINQSLLTLGRVITALVERTPHIPYRESKLTRLLQESLGGRTKTSIIATISPGHKDIEETLSTLDYAHRAKNIQNRPELNQKLTKKTVLKEYTEEIDRLKRDLLASRDKNGIYLAEETYNDINYKLDCQNKELNEKMQVIKALKDEMLNKEKIFNEVSLDLVEKTGELKKTQSVLNVAQTALDQTKKVLKITKRRNKENKMLLNHEIKTKQKLTSQATTLLQVVDNASTEHVKLQDTLERRKDIDIKIKTICEQYKDKMKTLFDSMKVDMNVCTTEHNSMSHLIKDEIKMNRNNHLKFSSNSIDQLGKISKSNENSIEDINLCMDNYSKKFINLSSDNRKILNCMIDELKSNEIARHDSLVNQLNKISTRITELNQIQETNYSYIIENTQSTKILFNKHFKTMENKFKNIIENLKKNFEISISKLCTHIEDRKKISQENKNTLLDIEKLFNKLKVLSMNENNDTEILEKFSSKLDNDKEEYISSINENLNEMNSWNDDCNKKCLVIENVVNEYQTDFNDKLILSNNEIIENKTENDCKNKECLETYNELEKVLLENEVKSVEMLSAHETEIDEKQKFSKTNIENNFKLFTDSVTNESNRIKEVTTQNIAYVTSLQDNVNDYSVKYYENIKECNYHLNNFHENELKMYTPTGETPSRKKFSYPRLLASTSPHENLVKRFRCENEWSDADNTIMEDSSCFILNTSKDFEEFNSTPIAKEKYDSPDETLHLSAIEKNFTNSQIPNLSDNIMKDFNKSDARKISPELLNQENKENFG